MYTQSPPISTIRHWDFDVPDEQRITICNTLINVLTDYYVHLPLKEKAFAINPIQELKLLASGAFQDDGNLSFLRKIQHIINKLRDRHTTFVLPEPWKSLMAFIPIIIEAYYENGQPSYIITKTLLGYENINIVGAKITHWNGIPIDSYIEKLGQNTQGANVDAQKKLAVSNLTTRSLAYTFLPDEDWVVLHCIENDGNTEIFSFTWRLYMTPPIQPTTGSTHLGSTHTGVDPHHLTINNFKKNSIDKPKNIDSTINLTLEGVLKYGTINTSSGDVGYIRIFSFEVGDVPTFIQNIATILSSLPQDKLIIDIRGNPGGIIPSGQQLVQLLCEKPISLSPVSFRNTKKVREFGSIPEFSKWKKSMDLMDATGDLFAQYFPLTDIDKMPLYRYPGKAALIIDSLVYSTSDFMAADFKDNNAGVIIGVDHVTGGGGANVWTIETLSYYNTMVGNPKLEPLPYGLSLNIAMRRSIRTGTENGLPVEDLGTKADFIYQLTRDDLTNQNFGLIEFTASMLIA